MQFIPEEVVKLLLAVVVGGLIGAEREFRDKAAGFRTIIFITLGSTLFTILSLGIGNETNPTRIAANIVTGIGFLGAGAIMRDGGKVAGLTTAATIWLAASLGMGLGGGRYVLVGVSTLVIMLVLWVFPHFEHWLDNVHETRTYEITLPASSPRRAKLEESFRAHELRVHEHNETRSGRNAITTWKTSGRPRYHKEMVAQLMADRSVIEFRF
jgi:putative Mg2+ transporter-C (MgtC) family protein